MLRPYQFDASNAIIKTFRRYKSTLLHMATGLGKTQVFVDVAARYEPTKRVLILAHREELVFQATNRIMQMTGEQAGIEMGSISTSRSRRCVVGCVPTLQRDRLARLDPKEFGLIIADEVHHCAAKSWSRIFDHFWQHNPQCRLLGPTATPRRADNVSLRKYLHSVAYSYDIKDAIKDGYLVPIKQESVEVPNLDLRRCRTIAGDLNRGDLTKLMSQKEILRKVVRSALDIGKKEPTLVFGASIAHAYLLAKLFNHYRPNSALALDGDVEKRTRRGAIEAFKDGQFQFLVGCDLFLEGFDAPQIATIVNARPTKSIVVYTQQMGRGTRICPGSIGDLLTAWQRKRAIASSEKPRLQIMDFVGNSGRHKLISSADVLGGNGVLKPSKKSESKPVTTNVKEIIDKKVTLQKWWDPVGWYKRIEVDPFEKPSFLEKTKRFFKALVS